MIRLLLVLIMVIPASPAQARNITVTIDEGILNAGIGLSAPMNMAINKGSLLSQDTDLVIEVTGETGLVERRDVSNASGPIAFNLPDDGRTYNVRAASFRSFRQLLVTDMVRISPDANPAAVTLTQYVKTNVALPVSFSCGNPGEQHTKVTLEFNFDNIFLHANGVTERLIKSNAANTPDTAVSRSVYMVPYGYENKSREDLELRLPQSMVVINSDRTMDVRLKSTPLGPCVQIISDPLLPTGNLVLEGGAEPVTILGGSLGHYTTSSDPKPQSYEFAFADGTKISGVLPEAVDLPFLGYFRQDRKGMRFTVSKDLAIDVELKPCTKQNFGHYRSHSWPVNVAVTYKGQTTNGCAGEPEDIMDGDWNITELKGWGPLKGWAPGENNLPLSIDFKARRITGFTGCNDFASNFITGVPEQQKLWFHNMQTCPGTVNDLEGKVGAAIKGALGFRVLNYNLYAMDRDAKLEIVDKDGTVLLSASR